MTYSILNNCDITTKYTVCDIKATSLAIATGIDNEQVPIGKEWMFDNYNEDIVGKYVQNKDLLSNAFFLLSVNDEDTDEVQPVIEWLAFNQNNDGSWGRSTKIKENLIETVFSAMALSHFNHSSTTEIVRDAKRWIEDFEPQEGWGDVEKNGLAFWAVKDQIRPFLKTSPQVILLNQEELPINLVNPTDFNIKDITFEFSDGLDAYVQVDPVAEIFKKSFKRIVLKLKNDKEETHQGFMTIKNNDFVLAKVPIITSKLPKIALTLDASATIYGDKTKIKASVAEKTQGTFTCALQWEDTLLERVFTVSDGQQNVDLTIETKEVKRQTRTVNGKIICTKDKNSIEQPVSLSINQYTTKPFDTTPKSMIIIETKKDLSFTIENLIDTPINVNIDFDKEPGLLEFDKRRITINPREKENITILNLIPENLNFTQDFTIIVSSLGQEEQLPLRVSIVILDSNKANFTNLYIILILGFIFTTAWGFLKLRSMMGDKKQYEQLRALVNRIRRNSFYQQALGPFFEPWLEKRFPMQMDSKASQEHITIDPDMIVAVAFMKTVGKDLETIKKKLKAQGFSDAYIAELLKQVA